ncbi:GDA1/CD39 family protein, partial [Ostertagia ostertagi]
MKLLYFHAGMMANEGDHRDEKNEKSYGVIMDAGSTGTRLFLYTWTSNSDKELIDIAPALDHLNNHVVMKVYPGLSTFQDRPDKAAEYIKPLLDYAAQFIPHEKLPYTPVFLLATAGMRLVPEKQQAAILTDLHTKLPQMTTMQIMKEHIRVIEGKWEGIYSWIAVNYILGKFKIKNGSMTSRPDTVGMIDMGGASMQIAFEMPPKDEFRSENVENVNLGCRDDDDRHKYKLFVTTFLGYGVNEGLRKYEQQLSDQLLATKESYVRDECMPVNLQKVINRSDGSMFVRKGIGDWEGCVKRLSSLLTRPYVHPKSLCKPNCFLGNVAAPMVSLSSMALYGFSEYWYSLEEVLSLGGRYNYSLIAEKSKQYCSQRWSAIQSAFNIAGQEVQWALGAMIYHMRYFPLRNSASNLVVSRHPHDNSLPSSFTLWLLMGAMIVLVAAFAVVILKEDISTGMRRNRSIWSYMTLNSSDTTSLSSFRSYWGNTVCVQSAAVNDEVASAIEKAITSCKGNLHLGRLFDKIRPKMKRDDAIVLLTDATTFKADITSYPLGMMFSVVVDLTPTNSDQISELNELAKASASEQLSNSNAKQWVLRYSDYNDVSILVDELMKSVLEPDSTILYVGNLTASISVSSSEQLVKFLLLIVL